MAAGFVGKQRSALGSEGCSLLVHWSGLARSVSHFTGGFVWDAVLSLLFIFSLFCLWENNSTFCSWTCVLGKMARGLYSPVDLAGVWDGVGVAVRYGSPVCAGKIKGCVFSFLFVYLFSLPPLFPTQSWEMGMLVYVLILIRSNIAFDSSSLLLLKVTNFLRSAKGDVEGEYRSKKTNEYFE